jgi:hypothetical protein
MVASAGDELSIPGSGSRIPITGAAEKARFLKIPMKEDRRGKPTFPTRDWFEVWVLSSSEGASAG